MDCFTTLRSHCWDAAASQQGRSRSGWDDTRAGGKRCNSTTNAVNQAHEFNSIEKECLLLFAVKSSFRPALKSRQGKNILYYM